MFYRNVCYYTNLLICFVIVGSVIFRSSANKNALLKITAMVELPSKGRNNLSLPLSIPREGTIHRY